MKVYLGSCEYKWTHKDTHMEQMWIMREIGAETYKQIEKNNFKWVKTLKEEYTPQGEKPLNMELFELYNER